MASSPTSDRARSPRYPSHSLEQALQFVRRIYEGVHRSAVDSLTAVKLMGFAGRSGASATALGSVRQYGLIEGVGDRTRVSELALSILEPVSDTEKSDSIRKASRQPQVFNQILERFEGRLPTANEPLRAFLIRELGFSKGGADDCLAALRATQAFVESLNLPVAEEHDPSGASVSGAALPVGSSGSPPDGVSVEQPKPAALGVASELVVIPLSKDCRVEMRFEGQLTEKAIDKLVRLIELMKEDWTQE